MTGDGSAVDGLAARLAQIEAERAILRTLYAYGHAIDAGDEAAWVDCFTGDGRFVIARDSQAGTAREVAGRDALRAFARAHSRRPERFHQHLVLEPVITVDGDTATCESYFVVILRHEEAPAIFAFGRYRDELRRCADSRWRLRRRDARRDGALAAAQPLRDTRTGS